MFVFMYYLFMCVRVYICMFVRMTELLKVCMFVRIVTYECMYYVCINMF